VQKVSHMLPGPPTDSSRKESKNFHNKMFITEIRRRQLFRLLINLLAIVVLFPPYTLIRDCIALLEIPKLAERLELNRPNSMDRFPACRQPLFSNVILRPFRLTASFAKPFRLRQAFWHGNGYPVRPYI
jgi:hypothetical protein